MARSVEFWLQLHRNFNPHEVLVGRRSDGFYCEREDSPFHDLLDQFSFTESHFHRRTRFLTGQSGSGISSSLLRLVEQLHDRYFPIYLDIGHNLDANKANRIDVLFLLGAAIQNAATGEGLSPDPENLIALVKSVRQLTHTARGWQRLSETARSAVSFGASSLGDEKKFSEAPPALPAFYSGVDDDVAQGREIEPQVREMINNLNLIIADVETLAGKPVLLVADGLNKIFRQSQIENFFMDNNALQAPICNIIYAAPLSIVVCQKEDVHFLPNITPNNQSDDYHRNGSRHHPLYEVVEKRLAPLNLQIGQLFDPGALELLIFKSGGLIRLFLSLISDSGKQAELMGRDRINFEAARKTVDNRSAVLVSRFNRKIVAELRALRQDGRSPGSGLSPQIINSQLIVAHKSTGIRFDVHPIIWDEVFGQTMDQHHLGFEAIAR